MKEQLVEEIVAEAYDTLNMPRNKSRETSHAQTRAAVAVALNTYFAQLPISKSLGINRSTISHYKGKHEENLKWWGGYGSKYKVARAITDSRFYSEVTEINIDVTLKQIRSLEEKLDRLRNSRGTNL